MPAPTAAPRTARFDGWSAFLVMLFAVVGLCGLFASYATSIPLERGQARNRLLDQVAAASVTPDSRTQLEQLRPRLDDLAKPVLDGQGPLDARISAARATILDEQNREESSLAYRTRLMLGIVTLIAATLAVGILSLARRTPPETP